MTPCIVALDDFFWNESKDYEKEKLYKLQLILLRQQTSFEWKWKWEWYCTAPLVLNNFTCACYSIRSTQQPRSLFFDVLHGAEFKENECMSRPGTVQNRWDDCCSLYFPPTISVSIPNEISPLLRHGKPSQWLWCKMSNPWSIGDSNQQQSFFFQGIKPPTIKKNFFTEWNLF